MKSVNTISLSGRLTSNAQYFDSKKGKVARFTVAHNFAKGEPALFLNVVMFGKKSKKDSTIPEALLTKGTPVLINGYLKRTVNTKDGVTYESLDLVAVSCDPLKEEAEGAAQ